MRILHTADWHLGRLFHGVHLTEEQAVVLDQLVEMARETRPDVVIVAGDVFDRPVPPAEAVTLLDEVLSRLVLDLRLAVILFPGNHDSPERLRFGGRLFEREGLFVVTEPLGRHLTLEDRYGAVDFYVFPYVSLPHLAALLNVPLEEGAPAVWARLLPRPARRSVLCTHAFVQGGRESPSETVLVGGADLLPSSLFEPYHFCALGHLHRWQTIASRLHYSGAILPYSFREAGEQKGVSLVEINAQGEVAIEFLPFSPRRGLVVLEGSFQELLQGPRREDFVKVVLTDEEPVFEAFRRLKAVYPYLVALEQPYFQGTKGLRINERIEHQEERLLFRGFVKEVTGEPPKEEDENLFQEVVNSLNAVSGAKTTVADFHTFKRHGDRPPGLSP